MSTLLNIDLGEHDDEPEELTPLADIANVACGGHAGDAASIARAVARCRAAGTAVGAHPSYEDREHFGRVRLDLPAAAVAEGVRRQCARLAFARPAYLKPHGALYHAADRDPELASAVVAAAVDALGPVAVIGPAGGELARAAARAGLRFLVEGFADRGQGPDGRLLPRGTPGALITDPAEAAAQALRLAPLVDTICVHGDTPGAVEIARAVRYSLRPMGQDTPVPPRPQ